MTGLKHGLTWPCNLRQERWYGRGQADAVLREGQHLDEQKALEGIELGSSVRRVISLRGRAVGPWGPKLPFVQVTFSQQWTTMVGQSIPCCT